MSKTYKNRNVKKIANCIWMLCIVLCTCCLSIGYAAITATNLVMDVHVTSSAYIGMFISDVTYDSNSGADITNSKIIDYTGTMLHSNIYLSETDPTSSITYTVTIFNNSDAIKEFSGVTYGDGYYSNTDIAYRLDGLQEKDIIEKGNSKTFTITFYYNSITQITNNQLDSYLSFNFNYYFEGANEVDIYITSAETYNFAGVSPEAPVDLANIANITFKLANGTQQSITGIILNITYTTKTGSKQSTTITLYDENNHEIVKQTAAFQKQTVNGNLEVRFDNLNIENEQKLKVAFTIGSMNNGHVDVSQVTITPILS